MAIIFHVFYTPQISRKHVLLLFSGLTVLVAIPETIVLACLVIPNMALYGLIAAWAQILILAPIFLKWGEATRVWFVCGGVIYFLSFLLSLASPIFALFLPLTSEAGNGQLFIGFSILLWAINVLTYAGIYNIFDERFLWKDKSEQYMWFEFPNYKNSKYLRWEPNYVDYLFLSLTTSLSFAPSDTAILSRAAKVIKMLQIVTSLVLIVIAIARGINLM